MDYQLQVRQVFKERPGPTGLSQTGSVGFQGPTGSLPTVQPTVFFNSQTASTGSLALTGINIINTYDGTFTGQLSDGPNRSVQIIILLDHAIGYEASITTTFGSTFLYGTFNPYRQLLFSGDVSWNLMFSK